jgi:predicted dehydrogenase
MHLVPIEHSARAELIACCDIKKDRADETAEKYGVKAYYDYEEMLDCEKLDAVHICLPHYLHCKVAIAAFERGVNVLTEKPMDVDLESAEKAVAKAKEKGVQFGVIFQCRYNNAAQLVKKAVESGRLGRIISARSTLTWTRPDVYYAESDWKGTWDKEGGGVVIGDCPGYDCIRVGLIRVTRRFPVWVAVADAQYVWQPLAADALPDLNAGHAFFESALGPGEYCGSSGVDGSFGGATDKALRVYQKDKGLAVDGSCGPATWNSLLGVKA